MFPMITRWAFMYSESVIKDMYDILCLYIDILVPIFQMMSSNSPSQLTGAFGNPNFYSTQGQWAYQYLLSLCVWCHEFPIVICWVLSYFTGDFGFHLICLTKLSMVLDMNKIIFWTNTYI